MQALEKADEARNAADKSVDIIASTMTTVDNILGQIGEYNCCSVVVITDSHYLQNDITVYEAVKHMLKVATSHLIKSTRRVVFIATREIFDFSQHNVNCNLNCVGCK